MATLSMILAAFLLVSTFGQQGPIVSMVEVRSRDPVSLVFEYANDSIPEFKPLGDGSVDCFVESLKATGLFTDVKTKVRRPDDNGPVSIVVFPQWKSGTFLARSLSWDSKTSI